MVNPAQNSQPERENLPDKETLTIDDFPRLEFLEQGETPETVTSEMSGKMEQVLAGESVSAKMTDEESTVPGSEVKDFLAKGVGKDMSAKIPELPSENFEELTDDTLDDFLKANGVEGGLADIVDSEYLSDEIRKVLSDPKLFVNADGSDLNPEDLASEFKAMFGAEVEMPKGEDFKEKVQATFDWMQSHSYEVAAMMTLILTTVPLEALGAVGDYAGYDSGGDVPIPTDGSDIDVAAGGGGGTPDFSHLDNPDAGGGGLLSKLHLGKAAAAVGVGYAGEVGVRALIPEDKIKDFFKEKKLVNDPEALKKIVIAGEAGLALAWYFVWSLIAFQNGIPTAIGATVAQFAGYGASKIINERFDKPKDGEQTKKTRDDAHDFWKADLKRKLIIRGGMMAAQTLLAAGYFTWRNSG